MANKTHKEWKKEEVFDVLNFVKDKMGSIPKYSLMQPEIVPQLAVMMNRTDGSIKAVLCIYRMFQKGHLKSLSTNMIKVLREYEDKSNHVVGQSSANQPVMEVEASTAIDNAFTDLDEAIDSLKPLIAKTIEAGVDAVCKQKNKRILDLEKEVHDLRTFKEEAKKSSVWAQLTQRMNRMA